MRYNTGFIFLKEMKRMSIKIHWVFRCTLTLAYSCLMFLMSSQDTSSVSLPPYLDKFIHFVEFGILCFMICWSLSPIKIGNKRIYTVIIAIAITSLYGMSDEIHQYFTPNRSVEIFDWLADTAGAVTAGLLWKTLTSRRRNNRRPLQEKSRQKILP
ncbi:MAG: VanZ family protein [wastewater metagenome]|nr:VanZ family protein [Candidatus Loosdrechtia aerotolerans]